MLLEFVCNLIMAVIKLVTSLAWMSSEAQFHEKIVYYVCASSSSVWEWTLRTAWKPRFSWTSRAITCEEARGAVCQVYFTLCTAQAPLLTVCAEFWEIWKSVVLERNCRRRWADQFLWRSRGWGYLGGAEGLLGPVWDKISNQRLKESSFHVGSLPAEVWRGWQGSRRWHWPRAVRRLSPQYRRPIQQINFMKCTKGICTCFCSRVSSVPVILVLKYHNFGGWLKRLGRSCWLQRLQT